MNTAKDLSIQGLLLRLAIVLFIVVAATWATHQIRDALTMQITPENAQQMRRALVLGMVAYVSLLSIPFVPGAEVGLALLTVFGAAIAPLVYSATVLAMMLAYALGRLVPTEALARILAALRLRKAADLLQRAAPLTRDERLEMMLDGAPPRLLALAVKHRYIALLLAVNTPGNTLIGGGGGIMMLVGISGIFAPLPTFLAVAVAVMPVPVAVMLFGA